MSEMYAKLAQLAQIIENGALLGADQDDGKQWASILRAAVAEIIGSEAQADALARSPFDLAPCRGCGEPVVCLPDGLPYCVACGGDDAENAEGGEASSLMPPSGAQQNWQLMLEEDSAAGGGAEDE